MERVHATQAWRGFELELEASQRRFRRWCMAVSDESTVELDLVKLNQVKLNQQTDLNFMN